MKPILKQKIAFFYPTGFIDGENAIEIISPLDVDSLIHTKPEGVFVSLKKAVFFNRRGISSLVESLRRIKEKNGAIIGFCDYDKKKYLMLVEMFKSEMIFSLFDTADIVCLYIGSDISTQKEKKIVVFHEKNEQKNQLALELFERGLTPVIAKNREDFTSTSKEADFAIEHSYLGNLDKTPTVFIKDNVIVYTLKSFVDSDMGTKFDMTYHEHSLTVGFKVFLFDATEVSSINIHGVNFIAKISTAGAEYGATIAICGLNQQKITKKLTNDLEDAGVIIYPGLKEFFEDDALLKEAHHSDNAVAKKGKGITKRLINSLPVIVEATLNTIENLSGASLVRKSLQLQEIKPLNTEGAFCISIGFYGDLDGVLILLFEKESAKKTCRILIEEDTSDGALLEALGEFVHIVGGKIAQLLLKQKIKIEITMPRVFSNLKEVKDFQQKNKGAQIDLEIDGKPLTLFLTK
jgi:CheY-specific phosphatase CheX/anti-anti-sigma regulatory factor